MPITVKYEPSEWQLPRTGSTLTGVVLGSHDRHNRTHAQYCDECFPLMEVGDE